MNKKVISFIIFISLGISGVCYSQSIEETLKYINAKILEHQLYYPSDFEPGEDKRGRGAMVYWETKMLSEDLEKSRNRETWSLDGSGMLTIEKKVERFFIPSGSKYPEWLSAPFQSRGVFLKEKREVFLKSLQLEVTVDDSRSDFVSVRLGCNLKLSYSCFSTAIMPGYQRYEPDWQHTILVDNSIEANKLANAIRHLIELANQKAEYLQKDPFAK